MSALIPCGEPASVSIAGRTLPFTTYRDIVRSYRSGLARAGIRPCDDRPQCFVLDATGTPIAKIGSRRTFAIGPDGYTDHNRLIFDFGEDE